MITLSDALAEAERKKVAIGHFNAPTISIIDAVIKASLKLNVPAIVGFSEGERDFFGLRQAVLYVKSVREQVNHPIFVNADHTYSLERVKQAIDVGFDSVVWDGADKSYEENRDIAKVAVEYAHASDFDVLVEAELGFIGGGSKIIEAPPDGAVITEEMMTKPEEAGQFVEETGIDLLAPAVGNLHGILKSGKNPHINSERVKDIRKLAGVPLVLHGGSGISDKDFLEGIKAGIAQVHVSTELRVANRIALEKALKDNPEQLAPYKFMEPVREAVQEVVEKKLRLFNRL